MGKDTGLFGLDREISLAGRVTTLRRELVASNAHTMRSFTTTFVTDAHPFGEKQFRYWAVIYKQPTNSEMFEVSKEDFDYLKEQGVVSEFEAGQVASRW